MGVFFFVLNFCLPCFISFAHVHLIRLTLAIRMHIFLHKHKRNNPDNT